MSTGQLERPEVQTEEATDPEVTADDIGANLAEAIREGAEEMEMNEFTEPSAQAAHGHGPRKGEGAHDIRGAFDVSEEFIREHFDNGVVPNGHEAVHFLLAGKEHFIEADEDIFNDTHDTNASRWQSIRDTAEKAPIPPGRRSQLEAHFS